MIGLHQVVIAEVHKSSCKRKVVNQWDGAICPQWSNLQPLPNSKGHAHEMSKLHYLQILIDHQIHLSFFADKQIEFQ